MFFLTSIGGWVFYPPPPFLSPQLSLASFGEYWAPCLEPARDFGQLDGDPLGAVLQPGHGGPGHPVREARVLRGLEQHVELPFRRQPPAQHGHRLAVVTQEPWPLGW